MPKLLHILAASRLVRKVVGEAILVELTSHGVLAASLGVRADPDEIWGKTFSLPDHQALDLGRFLCVDKGRPLAAHWQPQLKTAVNLASRPTQTEWSTPMIDFFEFSNELLCLADRRGYFTRVNAAWTRTVGWSAEELMSRPYVEFVHPDDVDATIREAGLLLGGTHETVSFENRYRCRDNSYRWLTWQATLEPNSCLIVASARDITLDRLQADAWQQSERRFRGIFERAPLGIALIDSQSGRFLQINPRYEELIGRTNEEMQQLTFQEITFPDDLQADLDQMELMLQGRLRHFSMEKRLYRGDGSIMWVNLTVVKMGQQGDAAVCHMAMLEDITRRKTAENALRADRELLRKLIDVQENEKQFLCQEFHDGLIQYAVGSLMALESYTHKHPTAEDGATLEMAIANLRRGVEDGRRTIRGIRPAVLDDAGLEAAIEDLVGQFSTSGILIKSDCDPAIGRLPGAVQTAVYRVVQEALNNAKKHSDTDVVRIQLRRSRTDLHLEIQDFGCGFDVESGRKLGFGLVGMTERVRLLGGECLIHSELDAGTRIVVRIPIST